MELVDRINATLKQFANGEWTSEELVKILDETQQHIKDAEDFKDEQAKSISELSTTTEMQMRTIQEQSDVLVNRETNLKKLGARHKELLDQIEDTPDLAEAVEELADSLELYGVSLARLAGNDSHALIAVSFIKVGHVMRGRTWEDAMAFLTGTTKTTSSDPF